MANQLRTLTNIKAPCDSCHVTKIAKARKNGLNLWSPNQLKNNNITTSFTALPANLPNQIQTEVHSTNCAIVVTKSFFLISWSHHPPHHEINLRNFHPEPITLMLNTRLISFCQTPKTNLKKPSLFANFLSAHTNTNNTRRDEKQTTLHHALSLFSISLFKFWFVSTRLLCSRRGPRWHSRSSQRVSNESQAIGINNSNSLKWSYAETAY